MTDSCTIALIESVHPPLPPITPIHLLHSHRHALATCFTYFNLEELIANSIVCQCWYRTTTDPIVWTHSTHLVWNTGTFIPLRFHPLVRIVRLQFMGQNRLMLQGRVHPVHELARLINCTDITLTQVQIQQTKQPATAAALSLFGLLPPPPSPPPSFAAPLQQSTFSTSQQGAALALRPIRRLTIQHWSMMTSSLDPAPFFQHPRMQLLEELTITFQPAPHFWSQIPQLVHLRCIRLGTVQSDISGILGELYENQLKQGLSPIDALHFQQITPNQQTCLSPLTRPFPPSITELSIRDPTTFFPPTVELFKQLTHLQILSMTVGCRSPEPLAQFVSLVVSFQELQSVTLTCPVSNPDDSLQYQYALNDLFHHNSSELDVTSLVYELKSIKWVLTRRRTPMTESPRPRTIDAASTTNTTTTTPNSMPSFTYFPSFITYLLAHRPRFSKATQAALSEHYLLNHSHLTPHLTQLVFFTTQFDGGFPQAFQQLPSCNLTQLQLTLTPSDDNRRLLTTVLRQLYNSLGRQTNLTSLSLVFQGFDLDSYDSYTEPSSSEPIEVGLGQCRELTDIKLVLQQPCSLGLMTILAQLPKLHSLKYGSMRSDMMPAACLAQLLKSPSLRVLELRHRELVDSSYDETPYDLGEFLSAVTADSDERKNETTLIELLFAHPHIKSTVNYVTPELHRQQHQQIKQKWSE